MPKAKRRRLRALKAAQASNGYSKIYMKTEIDPGIVLYRPQSSFIAEDLFAVFEKLVNDKSYDRLKHIWAVSDIKRVRTDWLSDYAGNSRVSFVRLGSKKYLEAMASAGVIFYENNLPRFFVKKEEQICVNLWNGIPLTRMGTDEKTKQPNAIWNVQKSFYSCDFLVTSNSFTTQRLMDAYQLEGMFEGTLLETGNPGLLRLGGDKRREAVKRLEKAAQLSLQGKKTILYAPSPRRENGRLVDSTRVFISNATKLVKGMPEGCVLLMWASQEDYTGLVKKKPDFPLLPPGTPPSALVNGADFLITDYNDIFFPFIAEKKPVVFYDYDHIWEKEKENFYINPEELPGKITASSKSVLKEVQKFSEGQYDLGISDAFRERYFKKTEMEPADTVVRAVFGRKGKVSGEPKGKKRILLHIGTFGKISDRELCLYILRNIDYTTFQVVVDGNDIYVYRDDFLKINADIKIVDSKFESNKSFAHKRILKDSSRISTDPELFAWEFRSMYGGLTFDAIVDTAGRRTTWMNMFAAVPCKHKSIVVNQANDTRGVLEEYASYVDDILIIDGDEATAAVDKKAVCISKSDFIARCGVNPLNVLFISAFDSTNYVFVNLIIELKKRGHSCTVVVKDKDDAINNKMYMQEGIDFVEIDEFDLKLVDMADFIFSAPLKYDCYNRLYKRINSANKFVITFASLFSSIVMGVNPDLSLSLGTSKFEEFRKNGLKYNLVAIGNPQYDHLIKLRRERPAVKLDEIRRVLIMEQGAYPFGREGKTILADVLCHMARKNPQMTFTVKPRYIPEEKGKQLHVLSEHLYDFITDKPDNLILLDKPTVLEDIMPEFDAAITTWSTAYLDAAVLGLPLILIEGLPSIDVYNVRNQRINDAYERLKHSGCVVNYQELYEDKPLPFRLVDEKYLSEELYSPHEPCVPRVMELLEFLYRKLIIQEKRWKTLNQLEYSEFFDKFDDIPLVDVGSNEFRQRKRLLNEVNRILQKFIFENRCMAEAMDIEPVYKAWDTEVTEQTSSEEITASLRSLKELTAEIRRRFFDEHFDLVCRDRILQDYYFQWLFTEKRYHELLNYNKELICPESLYFYRAVILYKKHRYKAGTRYMSQFFEISASKECKDLRKDMSLSGYLWKGRLGKYLILYYLDRYQAYEVIESVDSQGVIYQRDVMLYYKVKSYIGRGLYEEAISLCKEYSKNLLRKPKSKSVKAMVKYYVGRFFLKKTEKLSLTAKKLLEKQAQSESEEAI